MEATLNNYRELEDRIVLAKRFLNSELTCLRTKTAQVTNFNFEQIGYHLDAIHEIERKGVRRIDDMEFAKIRRVLTRDRKSVV